MIDPDAPLLAAGPASGSQTGIIGTQAVNLAMADKREKELTARLDKIREDAR